MSPAEALQELQQKSLRVIQRETAMKYAKRAFAAFWLCHYDAANTHVAQSGDDCRYGEEAIEHAGLSGDDLVLASVRQVLLYQGTPDAEAVKELRVKSFDDVQLETAITWAWRAYAAFNLWAQNPGSTWRDDAIEYAHEAVEHGALANDTEVLRTVRTIVPAKLLGG